MIVRLPLRSAAFALAAVLTATFAPSCSAIAYERLDQGQKWDAAAWKAFYTRDQGSRLIPYAWARALKLPDGQPFLADGLARYGYLPNPESPTTGLPVGFLVADSQLSLNCAACHTREIEVGGKSWRIDGGPALANMGALWADLDAAVGKLRSDPAAFAEFAKAVIAYGDNETEASLKTKIDAWYERHHAITGAGLPTAPEHKPWGAGRIDAVGMILNRVAGLDVGDPPSHVIKSNFVMADAPVRPPFLWNAWRQDQTQWPGFAKNGDRILALSRNVGQVFGVFGEFYPFKDPSHLLKFNYTDDNSVNFKGLEALERLIEKIEPPKWPWPLDAALAKKGEAIFMRHTDTNNPGASGCADCHWERPGEPRLLNKDTWCTPVQDVGTDAREYANYFNPKWKVKTGALAGADIPLVDDAGPLQPEDSPLRLLGTSVRGAILQQYLPVLLDARQAARADMARVLLAPIVDRIKDDLKDGYRTAEELYKRGDATAACKAAPKTPGPYKYESRVLYGIWAAAPYLHNGSAPTLAELLKPENERVGAFKIGPAYDIENVGLAVEQRAPAATQLETGCDRMSGASHCGHNYGVALSAEEKRALLEYLKKL
jgi:hypothetical protein